MRGEILLKSIYILDQQGFLLYSKNFMKEQYDENILIGFFTSVANFSREALNSIVKNVDLGENNKLILYPIDEENLLGAAIVNSNDNNDLVSSIIRDIMLEFVNLYAPDFNPEKIVQEDMEKVIDDNLRGKTLRSPFWRLFLSWIIVGPITPFLIFLSIFATMFIYETLNLNRLLTPEQLFTRFMPALILLSTANIIVSFLLPNLILGYLSPNWKIALLNSLIHFSFAIALYSVSAEPNFVYIVLGQLPLTLIFSLFFMFLGTRLSSKRFLK